MFVDQETLSVETSLSHMQYGKHVALCVAVSCVMYEL